MSGTRKLRGLIFALSITTGFISNAQAIAPDNRLRQHGGIYVEVEGLYARAHESLFSPFPFGTSNIHSETSGRGTITEVLTVQQRFHHFDPREKWGWRAALGYDFPSCTCCSYGFSLEYTYYRNDQTQRLANIIAPDFTPSLMLGEIEEPNAGFTDAVAKLDFNYQTVDFLGHANRTFCNCIDVQFFAGARYLNFREDFHDHLFVSPALLPEVILADKIFSEDFVRFDNRFNGVGPRFGVNTFYTIACGFGFVAEVAGDLILGYSNNKLSGVDTENFVSSSVPTESQIIINESPMKHQQLVVPGLSGRVALAYRSVFRNCSSLVIEAGYHGDKYFGLSDDSSFVQFANFPQTLNKDSNHHDFSVAGPYLSISFHA